MFVGGTRDRRFQQAVVLIYRHEHVDEECHELQVLIRVLARSQQVNAGVGLHRPVTMLTATVNACKRLLVKQHAEMVLTRNAFHNRHNKQVVVVRQIHVLEDRRHLKLVRCYLVMTRTDGYSCTQSFVLQVHHEIADALRNGAEIVVLELLVLGGQVSHQSATCQHEVRTGIVERFVHEEVFLFPA